MTNFVTHIFFSLFQKRQASIINMFFGLFLLFSFLYVRKVYFFHCLTHLINVQKYGKTPLNLHDFSPYSLFENILTEIETKPISRQYLYHFCYANNLIIYNLISKKIDLIKKVSKPKKLFPIFFVIFRHNVTSSMPKISRKIVQHTHKFGFQIE